jgi:hypothetical protein
MGNATDSIIASAIGTGLNETGQINQQDERLESYAPETPFPVIRLTDQPVRAKSGAQDKGKGGCTTGI